MQDYLLYVGTNCPFCKKVKDFMAENNINIDIVNINENRESMLKLMKESGKRQIPCLYHDGKYLYESNDIIEKLSKDFL